MERIDTSEIKGEWREYKNGKPICGGNTTLDNIRTIADKVNEIVDWINDKKSQLL